MTDCTKIRDAFVSGVGLPDAQVSEHLAGCSACRELFERDARLGRGLAAEATQVLAYNDDFFERVERKLAHETGLRAWLRSRPTSLRFMLLLLPLLLMVIGGGLLRQRADFAQYPLQRVAMLLCVYFLAIALAFGKELSDSPRGEALGDHLGLLVFALAVPVLAAFAPATEVSRSVHAGGLSGALGCFGYGALLTLPIGLLLWALDRDDRPSLRTVCLSAAALGLAANLLLELHCANGDTTHVLLGHASLGAAWLLAWTVTRRLSRA